MLLVTTLLVFSVLPVYAYDDKTSLNGYELSIQRFVGKISSKNEIEVAEDILKSIDLLWVSLIRYAWSIHPWEGYNCLSPVPLLLVLA